MRRDLKPLLAEVFGTFVLVFIGGGAGALGNGGIMGAAVAHGLALSLAIYMVGAVSGAHVNPAVTFGLAVAGKIDWPKAARYWVAQVLGGVVAAGALVAALGGQGPSLGTTTLADGVTPAQGVLVEAILTAFLVFAVMVSGVLGKNGNMAGLAIGLVLTMDILMGGGLTGASMNPARTLGPAIVRCEYADVWVYLVGPAAGGAFGALFAKYLHGE
jgi:aquaporin Z